jgi:hypothetical protein
VVSLVNDEKSELHRVKLSNAAAAVTAGNVSLNSRDDYSRLAMEQSGIVIGLEFAHLHVNAQSGNSLNLFLGLPDQFLPMRQDHRPLREYLSDDAREQNRLARACRLDD